MIVLVSGATAVVRAHPEVGVLVVPSQRCSADGVLAPGRVWAMDNGAFAGFNEPLFVRMLRVFHGRPGCVFVAAPDVVGDASTTLAKFSGWEPTLHGLGWPVALVAQDGLALADVPWGSFEALFIGGSTGFKLGPQARKLGAEAKARGKWLHMGRVNTDRRIRYAMRIGCDSVDGTSFSRWSKVYVPRAAHTMRRFRGGPLLEDQP